jgi:hypothetical protein
MNLRAIGVSSVILLGGCALFQKPVPTPVTVTTPAPIVVEKPVIKDTACDWDTPIVVTDGFIALLKQYQTELQPVAVQILKHNKTGQEKCGWTPVIKKDK